MSTLQQVLKRFNVKQDESPIYIPGSRYKDLPKLLWKIGSRKGVEVGVRNGKYSQVLCSWMPKLKLYCVDPWEDYDEYPERYITNYETNHIKAYDNAKKRLAPYNCELIKDYSENAVKLFKDGELDFVFIDGNHSFQYVVADIALWSRKVRKGGIISGHDYFNTREVGLALHNKDMKMAKDKIKLLVQTKDAVDAWVKTNDIKPLFILTKERAKAWFWVKE